MSQEEKTNILLAAPAVIPPTMLSYNLAIDVAELIGKRNDFTLTMLHGPVATRGAMLFELEKNPDLVIYMGHGTETALCGESFFCDMLTTEDVRYLNGKIVIANPACQTGVKLGPAAVEIGGAKCFMGALTPMYAAFPEEDHDYQADWFDYILELYRVLMTGTTGEAYQAYYRKCTYYIDMYYAKMGEWESADWYFQSTTKNRDQFKLFGDPNARVNPNLVSGDFDLIGAIIRTIQSGLSGLGL